MNQQDRELLELAAKAAGIEGDWSDHHQGICYSPRGSLDMHVWRPHKDDGDALRLAVMLRIPIRFEDRTTVYNQRGGGELGWRAETVLNDLGGHHAATRRAIVRAAAKIGEAA